MANCVCMYANGHQTFDEISLLWPKICAMFHSAVETKHQSHQCHQERIQKNQFYRAISVFNDRSGCTVLILKDMCHMRIL